VLWFALDSETNVNADPALYNTSSFCVMHLLIVRVGLLFSEPSLWSQREPSQPLPLNQSLTIGITPATGFPWYDSWSFWCTCWSFIWSNECTHVMQLTAMAVWTCLWNAAGARFFLVLLLSWLAIFCQTCDDNGTVRDHYSLERLLVQLISYPPKFLAHAS
jgi:hypothetical protein